MYANKLLFKEKLSALNFLLLFLFCAFLLSSKSFAQEKERKINYILSLQGNKTFYDYTKKKNPGGAGVGLQLAFIPKHAVQPILEFNLDAIGGKKEEFFFIDGNKSTHQTKSIISSVFIGSLVKVSNSFSSSLTIGSSFFSNKAHFGIRPSVIYYPSKIEKWNIKMMFTHVPFKDDFTGIDFGYLSVSIGINLSK